MGISDLIAGFLQECLDETGDGVLEIPMGDRKSTRLNSSHL